MRWRTVLRRLVVQNSLKSQETQRSKWFGLLVVIKSQGTQANRMVWAVFFFLITCQEIQRNRMVLVDVSYQSQEIQRNRMV